MYEAHIQYKVERNEILDWYSFSYGALDHSTKKEMISYREGYKKEVEECSMTRIIKKQNTHRSVVNKCTSKYMFLCFNIYMWMQMFK